MLRDIGKQLNGAPATSRDGFEALLKPLSGTIVPASELEYLHQLGDAIFKNESPDAIKKAIDDLLARIENKVGPFVETAVRIAQNSVQFAREQFKDISPARLRFLVASDVIGVLTSGQYIASLGHPALMVLVAGVAAVASSTVAAYLHSEEAGADKNK